MSQDYYKKLVDGENVKIAAIQLEAAFADVEHNLFKSENHIKQAAQDGVELVVLPEFFTSAIGFSEKMLNVAVKNKKAQNILLRWAKEYQIIIGGSYIHFDGKDAHNLFTLVFPNGEVYKHKKDIPTQFENCYYTDGDENNIFRTPIGNIGIAMCWEMIRYDTLKRLSGNVDIVLAGSCWWDLPKDADLNREPLRQYNQKLALETPVTFAKLLGVPVVHSNHCGEVLALNFPKSDKLQSRQLVGAAQIINGSGDILARRKFDEGKGAVISSVSWNREIRKKPLFFPSKQWIPDLPSEYINAWETLSAKGKEYYVKIALPYYEKCYKSSREHDRTH